MGSYRTLVMEGGFKLEWTEFEQVLVSSFEQLRHEKDLFDVTLVCDDGQVEAHKVILSAGSGFFKSILKRNPHSHPLIYMRGVSMVHMTALFDFIYLGLTSVSQDNVKSLLRLGEELGVKGMIEDKLEGKEEEEQEEEEEEQEQEQQEQDEERNKALNRTSKDSMNQNENIQNLNLKLEERSSFETEENLVNSLEILHDDYNKTDHDTTLGSEINEELTDSLQYFHKKQKTTSNSGKKVGFKCDKCDKFYKAKQNLNRHAETHIEGLAYNCAGCEKVFKTKNSLQFHMYTKCRSNRLSN